MGDAADDQEHSEIMRDILPRLNAGLAEIDAKYAFERKCNDLLDANCALNGPCYRVWEKGELVCIDCGMAVKRRPIIGKD